MEIKIRKGELSDIADALNLIKELAEYENAPNEVETSIESMTEDGFGDGNLFKFLVAESDNKVIGIAVYFYTYSTWKGRVLYLEDLVVKESFRRHGIGKMLFDELVSIAVETKCKRMSWQVLEWNEPAIKFYEKIGAEFDGEWINCRLTYNDLKNYNF